MDVTENNYNRFIFSRLYRIQKYENGWSRQWLGAMDRTMIGIGSITPALESSQPLMKFSYKVTLVKFSQFLQYLLPVRTIKSYAYRKKN